MMKLIQSMGNAAAVVGTFVCLVAGLARLGRTWSVAGVAIAALFQVGIALMVFACLAKLQELIDSQRVSGAGKQR
jgi:uncharacterized protein with PQ loop repeat